MDNIENKDKNIDPEVLMAKMQKIAKMLAKAMIDKIGDEGIIDDVLQCPAHDLFNQISLFFNYEVLRAAMIYARNSGDKYSKETKDKLTNDYALASVLMKLADLEED